jgi:hypothetical protein
VHLHAVVLRTPDDSTEYGGLDQREKTLLHTPYRYSCSDDHGGMSHQNKPAVEAGIRGVGGQGLKRAGAEGCLPRCRSRLGDSQHLAMIWKMQDKDTAWKAVLAPRASRFAVHSNLASCMNRKKCSNHDNVNGSIPLLLHMPLEDSRWPCHLYSFESKSVVPDLVKSLLCTHSLRVPSRLQFGLTRPSPFELGARS